jgi:hypothetical protein
MSLLFRWRSHWSNPEVRSNLAPLEKLLTDVQNIVPLDRVLPYSTQRVVIAVTYTENCKESLLICLTSALRKREFVHPRLLPLRPAIDRSALAKGCELADAGGDQKQGDCEKRSVLILKRTWYRVMDSVNSKLPRVPPSARKYKVAQQSLLNKYDCLEKLSSVGHSML